MKDRPYFLHWLHFWKTSFRGSSGSQPPHTTHNSTTLRVNASSGFLSYLLCPKSLFTASWSAPDFDVRQVWTRADLQLTNNEDQKHPCEATSSWQPNAASTVPPAPSKKPCVCQEGLTMNTCTLYSHPLFRGTARGQLLACVY